MRLALDGVFAPAAGVCVAAGAGWVAGVGPTVGLAAAAMLAAAVFVVPVLGSEWGDQVSVSRERMEQVRGGSRRGPEALGRLRGETDGPTGAPSERLRTFAAGLFFGSLAAVALLAGPFGLW